MVAALDESLIHYEEGMNKLMNRREMTEVLDRLRLSRQDDIEAGVEAGFREGQRWANYHAKLGQLKTVASGRMKDLQELFEFLNAADAWDPDTYREALDDRDDAAFGKGFATGFVRGAAHVWAQVRREL